MKLTKDTVKNLLERKTKTVRVADFEIRLIEMTIPQQLEIESALQLKKTNTDLIFPVLKFSVVDEDDVQLLDDESIKALPAAIAAELFKQCIEFNAITEKDLEERAKNS